MISSIDCLRPGMLALGLSCALLASPLAAQDRFIRSLPQGTLAFVSAPDLQSSFEKMKDTPVARMWREDQVQAFFADALKLADERWDEMLVLAREEFENGENPLDPDEMVKARMLGVSMALTSFALTPVEDSEPLPRVGLLLHFEFGDTAPIWHNAVHALVDRAMADSPEQLLRSTREVGGTQLLELRPTDQPQLEMGISLAFVGTGLVVGTLSGEVEQLLLAMKAGEDVLTASEDYLAASGPIGTQGAEVEVFVRPGAMLDSMGAMLRAAREHSPRFPTTFSPEGLDRAFKALGLRSMGPMSATSTYVDGHSQIRSFMASPAESREGLMAGDLGTLNMDFLRWVPADAVSVGAFRMDAPQVYRSLRSALLAYDVNLGEQLFTMLSSMEEQMGVSVENDLFGAFGKQFAYWSMPMAALGTPELAVIAEVEDPVRLLAALENLCKAQPRLELSTNERRGMTYHQLRLNIDAPGGARGMAMGMDAATMFTPTFAFADGHMALGLSTGDVKRALKRLKREDDPSGDIRSNPEFTPWMEKLPKEDLASMSFTDWKSSFESQYQVAAALLAFIPFDQDIPFDLSLLPDSGTLTKHLFPAVSWSRQTESGFLAESITPFGPETIIPVAMMLGAAGATFGMMRNGMGFGLSGER